MEFQVVLNGTDKNPYLPMGLQGNPFPQQIQPSNQSVMEIEAAKDASITNEKAMAHLQELAAHPITDAAQIREHLQGWSEEFIDLCCEQFRPGQVVHFTVRFNG